MHLSHPALAGKPQRACTPQGHASISASGALFATLTTPAGYQDSRSVGAGVLEIGICRNCGSSISRKLTDDQQTMWELGIGDLR